MQRLLPGSFRARDRAAAISPLTDPGAGDGRRRWWTVRDTVQTGWIRAESCRRTELRQQQRGREGARPTPERCGGESYGKGGTTWLERQLVKHEDGGWQENEPRDKPQVVLFIIIIIIIIMCIVHLDFVVYVTCSIWTGSSYVSVSRY